MTPTTLEDLVRDTARQVGEGRRGPVAVGALRKGETACSDDGPPSLFEIGSVTKTFTSLALARLAVWGSVRIDQPLSELLRAAVPERSGRPIELRHLACHTSGLPRLPKGMLPRALLPAANPYAGCTARMLLAGLGRTRLRSAPGRRFHYSNLGAGLLGMALSRHTGTDYETLIRTQITEPLGLTDTRVALVGTRQARLAPGHSRTGHPRRCWDLADLVGAGGLYSTVPDLLRFAAAQLGDRDTPGELAEAIALTHSTAHPMRGDVAAHPGWISLRERPTAGGHRVLFHNGGTGGYRSLVAIAPDHQAAVVVLSANARSVDRAGLHLLRRLVTTDR